MLSVRVRDTLVVAVGGLLGASAVGLLLLWRRRRVGAAREEGHEGGVGGVVVVDGRASWRLKCSE